MEQKGRTVLGRIVDKLVEEYQPDKIFLFGSYAYGRPHEDSDLDLFLVKDAEETEGDRWSRRSEVRQIISPVRDGMSVDIFVLTPSELHEELLRGNQFYQEMVSRGILLYGEPEEYPMVEDSSSYARDWLSPALDYLQAAELTLERGLSANVAGALLQQAVEKCLKAYLLFRGWRLKRTHDLEELLEDAIVYAPDFEQYRAVCVEVTKYYVDDRYPRNRRELTHREVEEALEQLRPLIDKIIESLH
jgi:HEPN domain-containing protein/predicted nucleotidyltransferase